MYQLAEPHVYDLLVPLPFNSSWRSFTCLPSALVSSASSSCLLTSFCVCCVVFASVHGLLLNSLQVPSKQGGCIIPILQVTSILTHRVGAQQIFVEQSVIQLFHATLLPGLISCTSTLQIVLNVTHLTSQRKLTWKIAIQCFQGTSILGFCSHFPFL